MARKSGLNPDKKADEAGDAGGTLGGTPEPGAPAPPEKEKPKRGGGRKPKSTEPPKQIAITLSEDATARVLALGRAYGVWGTPLAEPDGTSVLEQLAALYEERAFTPHMYLVREQLQAAKDAELEATLAEVFGTVAPAAPADLADEIAPPIGEASGVEA